jgi:putative endopeptidase
MTDTTGAAEGTVGTPDRASSCFHTVLKTLGVTVNEVYAKNILSPAVRAQATKIVGQLDLAMSDMIQHSSWLSDSTKQVELDKLRARTFSFGYGDTTWHWPDYMTVTLSPDDFRANQAALANTSLILRNGSYFFPLYIPFATSGSANAALLTIPLYDSTDLAVVYGGFGFIVGHELGHSFDHPNVPGNITHPQPTWWTPDELQAFRERSQRILAPYVLAHVDSLYKTQNANEHIADYLGLHLSYALFEQAMRGKPRTRIDGMTPEQRFFVGFGSAISYIYAFLTADQIDLGGGVSKPRTDGIAGVRMNIPLSHFPAFAKAFGCKAGDAMVQPEQDLY